MDGVAFLIETLLDVRGVRLPATLKAVSSRFSRTDAKGVQTASREAAEAWLDAEPSEQLSGLLSLPIFSDRVRGNQFAVSSEMARQLARIAGDAQSVRFTHGLATLPALVCAFTDRIEKREREIGLVVREELLAGIAEGLALAFDLPVAVTNANPFTAVDDEWDTDVSLPPFGMRDREPLDLPRRTADLLGSDDTLKLRSFDVLALANEAAHVRSEAVVWVPDGVLFRDVGAEKFLRGRLLDRGQVRAVLSLPPGSLSSALGLKTSILVLGPRQSAPASVRMVDVGSSDLVTEGMRGRAVLRDDASLRAVLEKPPRDAVWCRDVPLDEIEENGNVLVPERYLVTNTVQRVRAFAEAQNAVPLGDIADLIRAGPLKKGSEGEYTIREASPGDIGSSGYLQRPERSFSAEEGVWFAARKQIVRPGDVLITSKGTIGVVGLTPDGVPDVSDQEIWTVGQSLMIARIKPNAPVSPIAVYQYLSSEPVREFMRSLASGSTIANFNIADMRALPIPVLDEREKQRIETEFADMQDHYERLAELQRKVAHMRGAAWPVREIEGGE